jgi:SAM-dependent methyltransferase
MAGWAIVLRYDASTYGDAFADVYDDWYGDVSDADATADLVVALAGRSRPAGATVLELGVGTGRVALPLVARGLDVTGVDASAAMLTRLRERDADRRVRTVLGDMVDDLPPGPFDVVVAAYNTLFNLLTTERQAACVAAVAGRLAPAGSFVVEAFVPEDPPRDGDVVTIRSMSAHEVVLSISRHDPAGRRAEGHFVHLADGRPVRLRPWSIHYCTTAELDAMAAAAGLVLTDRWEDVGGARFGPDSARHVSVYAPAGRP